MIIPALLQTNFLPQADTKTTYITLGIVAVFILILVIGSFAGNRSSGSSTAAQKKLSPRAGRRKFLKIAKNMGLSSVQIKLLEDIAEKYRVPSPLVFITSSRIFNSTMKKAINDLDSGAYSTDVKESTKMTIYSIRQKLDRNVGTGKNITTTRQMRPGQQLAITTDKGEKYTVSIIANLKDYICAGIADPAENQMPRFKKWETFAASLYEKGDRGYSFATKLIGYTTMKNKSCMMLQHSNSISFSKQRKFPRKEFGKPCYFYKINIVTLGKGKNEEKKAVLNDKKGRLGTIEELSAGGCSIKGSNILNKGEFVKIDIEIERKKPIAILGKIVNTRRLGVSNNIMHVQFTKMTRNNFNTINSFVYGIMEKDSILDY